jgi:hypothetical protein
MTLRSLRNQAVFWSGFLGLLWVLKQHLQWGWLGALPAAFAGGLVAVVVIALLTDRFLD